MNRFSLVSKILSVIGLFGVLLYFVGRIYIENYYAVLSVPIERMNLGYTDYVYYGGRPFQVLIPAFFTFLGIRLWVILFPNEKKTTALEVNLEPRSIRGKKKYDRWKILTNNLKIFWNGIKNRNTFQKWQNKIFFFYLIFLFGSIVYGLVWLVGLQQFGSSTNFTDLWAYGFVSMFLAFTLIYFGLLFSYDKGFRYLVQTHKTVKKLFMILATISLFLFPYIAGGSYGTLTGIFDIEHPQSTFDDIDIVALTPVNDLINWTKLSDGSIESNNNILIYDGQDDLYLKTQTNLTRTIVIAKSSIISYSIVNPSMINSPSKITTSPVITTNP